MMNSIAKVYAGFEPGLVKTIEDSAVVKHFKTGEVIIRTGQYIQSTMLILSGKIKVYREDSEGNEFFMYYL
ncbi:MAG: cyclic nucleotide-binding domain-containing protein, partial [Bacteroidetes bacterium]|nr:cyclic nucleotide-binding domain-containing protein [Bacteroidota bacterium]